MNISLHPKNLRHWQDNALEYMRYEVPQLTKDDVVLDIGAYEGEFARKINDKYGCHVVCIEPTIAITGLQRNPNFTVINKAAGTHDGQMRFGGQYYYTSAYQDGYAWRDFDCLDILSLFNREYGLVKINIEGCEYEIMRHLIEHGVLEFARVLQIQFHFIDGRDCEAEYRDICNHLLMTHRPQWCCEFVWDQWVRR